MAKDGAKPAAQLRHFAPPRPFTRGIDTCRSNEGKSIIHQRNR
jgi:hypothetical protein